jgi:arsenite-transporting ATPase
MQIRVIQEGLSGACTTEIASFDEFSRFITNEGILKILITLFLIRRQRDIQLGCLNFLLLGIFFWKTTRKASCIGPSSALKSSKSRYKQVITSLKDPNLTTFI